MIIDYTAEEAESSGEYSKLVGRRDFLMGLRKWSQPVIVGIVLGGFVAPELEAGWVNAGGRWVCKGRGASGGARSINRHRCSINLGRSVDSMSEAAAR
jgi:hypothetical protein